MSENELHTEAIQLLKQLIATPSYSREESGTADLIQEWLKAHGIETERLGNNVWAVNAHFDAAKPTILLNSHHDTVKPNKAYTRDPFLAQEEDGKLFGLGSNDAGGCLVSLLSAFVHFHGRNDLKYNLLMAASAEEENSGANGISSLLPLLPPIACGIVGEPTSMNMAVAEKGLMVIDGLASGRACGPRECGQRLVPCVGRHQPDQKLRISESVGNVRKSKGNGYADRGRSAA